MTHRHMYGYLIIIIMIVITVRGAIAKLISDNCTKTDKSKTIVIKIVYFRLRS